jgi:hypothetical protein
MLVGVDLNATDPLQSTDWMIDCGNWHVSSETNLIFSPLPNAINPADLVPGETRFLSYGLGQNCSSLGLSFRGTVAIQALE